MPIPLTPLMIHFLRAHSTHQKMRIWSYQEQVGVPLFHKGNWLTEEISCQLNKNIKKI